MNAINFYNLLYLTEKLRECATKTEREDLLKTILQSSTHTWRHINLAGEYDFSELVLPDVAFAGSCRPPGSPNAVYPAWQHTAPMAWI